MYNSTVFSKLKPNQELILVRYSHAPEPDFITVIFNYFNTDTNAIEFIYKGDEKKRLKKYPVKKAEYRIFIDELEMAKALMDCFFKREIPISEKYAGLMETSQNERPEIWI